MDIIEQYSALRKRVEKLEEINKEQSELIKGLTDHALISIYKPDFDRAIVQRDAAREELKDALAQCQSLRQEIDSKYKDVVETELRAQYDAADKECSILRARVEEVERINLGLLTQLDDRSRDIASLRTQKDELSRMNLMQSGRIKEMMEHGVNTVYKPDFDRAIVQRDAAREELKHALDECQLMRQAIVVNRGDINRLTLEREEAITRIKHVSLQRDDHRRVADAYKARLDQIQGIVNP